MLELLAKPTNPIISNTNLFHIQELMKAEEKKLVEEDRIELERLQEQIKREEIEGKQLLKYNSVFILFT